MYLPNIAAWILITVLNGGSVSHSEGFQSFSACQDARQLVLTGRTVEKEKEYMEEFAKAQAAKKAARKEYEKSNPNYIIRWADIDSSGYVYNVKVAECVPEVHD